MKLFFNKNQIKTSSSFDLQNQLSYLEEIYTVVWKLDPKGKIKNALVNDSTKFLKTKDLNFTTKNRVELFPENFGQVEFLLQDGVIPSYETTIPEIVCVHNDKEWESWHEINGGNRYQNAFKFIIEKYRDTHYFPDANYLKWVIENKNHKNVAEFKKHDLNYAFIGIFFTDHEGYNRYPDLISKDGIFSSGLAWVGQGFGYCPRFVLLKK